jgi:hypothetical protein
LLPSPLEGEGGERGAIASASRVRGTFRSSPLSRPRSGSLRSGTLSLKGRGKARTPLRPKQFSNSRAGLPVFFERRRVRRSPAFFPREKCEGNGAPRGAAFVSRAAPSRDDAGASRRSTDGVVTAPGRAFGEPSASSSALSRQFPSAGSRASELRASARLSRQPAPGRGSLVSPGGAPAPPGCAPCEGTRAGAAPAPPRERL